MPRTITRHDPNTNLTHFWTHYNTWLEFVQAGQKTKAWTCPGTGADGPLPEPVVERALYGWAEGRARLRTFGEKLDLKTIQSSSTKFAQSFDLGGQTPDIQAFVAGAPDHMVDYGDQNIASHPIIRLQANIDAPGWIRPEWMQNQAIAVCSLCDILEAQGYQCEIKLVNATYSSGGGPSLTMFTCAFKNAGEALDRDIAVYALGHNEILREYLFRIYMSDPAIESRFRRSMGSPTQEIPEDYTDLGAINLPPADRDCTMVEKSLKRLINIVKGQRPEVNWDFFTYILEILETLIEAQTQTKN